MCVTEISISYFCEIDFLLFVWIFFAVYIIGITAYFLKIVVIEEVYSVFGNQVLKNILSKPLIVSAILVLESFIIFNISKIVVVVL